MLEDSSAAVHGSNPGPEPRAGLVMPVDVGKSSAMALVADHYGEMVVAPFELALTETAFALLAASIPRARWFARPRPCANLLTDPLHFGSAL